MTTILVWVLMTTIPPSAGWNVSYGGTVTYSPAVASLDDCNRLRDNMWRGIAEYSRCVEIKIPVTK
jgi:hypothetical protein